MAQYDPVALDYEKWIAPRFRSVADGLAQRCPWPADRVLEVAAGTGIGARALLAAGANPQSYVVTDISAAMLRVARDTLAGGAAVRFGWAVADCARLPVANASVDLVVSSLGPLQDRASWLREARRVLRPGGHLAVAMWGPRYSEVRMHNRLRAKVGVARLAPADAAGAVRRLGNVGFTDIVRDDVRLPAVHDSAEGYLSYRRAFGRSPVWSDDTYSQYFAALHAELGRRFGDGQVVLDWTITYLTGAAPR